MLSRRSIFTTVFVMRLYHGDQLTLAPNYYCTPPVYVTVLLYVPMCVFFLHLHAFLRRPWVLSRGLGCGARLYTAQIWVPGGLRGACCGSSKSRNLTINHGVAFRGARAEQGNGKPTRQLFFVAAVKGSNTVTTFEISFPRYYGDGHYCACVVMMYACMCCVHVYGSVHDAC